MLGGMRFVESHFSKGGEKLGIPAVLEGNPKRGGFVESHPFAKCAKAQAALPRLKSSDSFESCTFLGAHTWDFHHSDFGYAGSEVAASPRFKSSASSRWKRCSPASRRTESRPSR
jgi:hypothetical protein